MNEYERENMIRVRKELNQLNDIAKAMGDDWNVTDACSDDAAYTSMNISNGEANLVLCHGEYLKKDRLIVRIFIKDRGFLGWNENTLSITMDINRDINLLVKAIKSRILGEAESLFKREVEYSKMQAERKRKEKVGIDRLIKLGVEHTERGNLYLNKLPNGVYCRSIQLHNNSSEVSLELSGVSIDKFEAIMKVIKE